MMKMKVVVVVMMMVIMMVIIRCSLRLIVLGLPTAEPPKCKYIYS